MLIAYVGIERIGFIRPPVLAATPFNRSPCPFWIMHSARIVAMSIGQALPMADHLVREW